MNYKLIYDILIQKRKQDPATGYTENHHIVMRSMGGLDDKENLVRLTGREHWIAHRLLHKIHQNQKTACACHMMAMRCEERGIPEIKNSRAYEYIRKEFAEYISPIVSQSNRDRKGIKYKTRKNKKVLIEFEYKCKECDNLFYRSHHTKQNLDYCSRQCAGKARAKINHGSHLEAVRSKISKTVKEKWQNGEYRNKLKGKKKPVIKCPHCDKCGSPNNMYRWHFDNCKFRPV